MSENNSAHSNRNSHNLTPWEQYQIKQNQQIGNNKKRFFLFHNKRSRKKTISKPHHVHVHSKLERVWFFAIFSPLIILLLLMIYLASPISKIKHVRIIGSDVISNSTLQEEFQFSSGYSIFHVYWHKKELANQIKNKYPQFKNVDISTKALNHVNVSLSEYHIEGYLQVNTNYQPILSNGVVLNKILTSRQQNLPLLRKFNDQTKLKLMLNQYSQLSNNIQNMISLIDFSPTAINPERIHLYMKNKNQVYASIGTFDNKMQYYPSISSKNKEPQIINFELGAYSYPLSQSNEDKVKNKKSTYQNKNQTKKRLKTTMQKNDNSNQTFSSQNSGQKKTP